MQPGPIIKVGVIGVGHLGRAHAKWYQSLEGCELAGFYETNVDRAQSVSRELNCRAFESLDEFFNAVDAVSVATFTSQHFETARAALTAGCHCLVEKPITTTSAEAEALIELADRKQLVLAVGHIERFNPAVDSLRAFDLRPRFIEAHRLAAFNPRGADVAVILDLMIHDIDLVLHLVPSQIARIDAAAVAVVSATDDIANARLTFENGTVANLTASRISLQSMRKMRIFQESSYFSLDFAKKTADIYRLDNGEFLDEAVRIPMGASGKEILYTQVPAGEVDMLRLELEAFVNKVRFPSAKSILASGACGLASLEIAEKIQSLARDLQSRGQ